MSASMVALGVAGLLAVLTFCGWATFREPWNVGARRAERRSWLRDAQLVAQPSVPAEPGRDVQLAAPNAVRPADRVESEPTLTRQEPAPDDHLSVSLRDLDDELLRSTTGDVHVDVSAVTMMTVKDFWSLIRAQRQLETEHRGLIIRGADGPRRRALEIAQLGEFISPDDDARGSEPSAA